MTKSWMIWNSRTIGSKYLIFGPMAHTFWTKNIYLLFQFQRLALYHRACVSWEFYWAKWHRRVTLSVQLKRQMTLETKKVSFLQAWMLVTDFGICNSSLKFFSVLLFFLAHIEKLRIKIPCTASRLSQTMKCGMQCVGSPDSEKLSPIVLITTSEILL